MRQQFRSQVCAQKNWWQVFKEETCARNIVSSTTLNSQQVEAAQMSISK